MATAKRRTRSDDTNTIRDNKAVIRKILRFSNLTTKAPVEVLNKIIPHYRDHQSTRPNSINAEIRAAKSVFCPRCIELYQSNGIQLPNLTPFRNLSLLRGNKPEGLPPLEIMQQLDSRESELRGDLLKAWILVRYAGMRNREIYELKTEALQTNGERFWIDPDHTKTGESRQNPVREEHMQFLLNGAGGFKGELIKFDLDNPDWAGLVDRSLGESKYLIIAPLARRLLPKILNN